MQKLLTAWNQDETTEVQKLLESLEQPLTNETTMFKPTNNVSQATFNFVRDNSGCSRHDCIRILVQQGHKKSSVTSLLGQMIRQGHIWKDGDGLLRPNGKEYTPLKSAKTVTKNEKKIKVAKTSKVRTFDAPVDRGIARLIDRPVRSKIESILDGISLNDAHELYRELHTYFGGLPK
jgi:hypothetical protein